jgi:hypothetical protein
MKLIHSTGVAAGVLLLATTLAQANTVTWEAANSLVDTTNFSGVGPYYWFANFNNPTAVTGATTDASEARNLPSWLHLETRHAFIGKDDSGLAADSTIRTGYSFVENGAGTAGGGTVGGQPNFNTLTLPGGLSGISGQVLELQQGLNNTTSQLSIRVDAGAPDALRIWVVTDNGAGANFNIQNRIRINLRNTDGAPNFADVGATIEAEALPEGLRLIQAGSAAYANNGLADAWSFKLGGVQANDVITVRPTGGAGFTNYTGFAGLIIQPVPEPATATLIGLALVGLSFITGPRR